MIFSDNSNCHCSVIVMITVVLTIQVEVDSPNMLLQNVSYTVARVHICIGDILNGTDREEALLCRYTIF